MQLIRDWIDLEEYTKSDPSPTHFICFEGCDKTTLDNGKETYYCAHVRSKDGSKNIILSKDCSTNFLYLSTHTFYGNNYQHSTKMLQQCGFDVQLANWDADDEGS